MGAEKVFTTPELQRRYDRVEISLLTPKCTLVPEGFFSEDTARELLAGVVKLRDTDPVSWVPLPQLNAVLVFSNALDEALSRAVAGGVVTTSGETAPILPEMYYLLREVQHFGEYNKILCSYMDGYLHLVIAQGRSLLLANIFEAQDFTTAEYYIFLALKRFQLNPEISVIALRTPLTPEAEMSLYRYFKSVVRL